jgi:hypothetical protein
MSPLLTSLDLFGLPAFQFFEKIGYTVDKILGCAKTAAL